MSNNLDITNVRAFIKIDPGSIKRVKRLLFEKYHSNKSEDYIRKVLNEKSTIFNEIIWNCILTIAEQNMNAQKENLELERKFGE